MGRLSYLCRGDAAEEHHCDGSEVHTRWVECCRERFSPTNTLTAKNQGQTNVFFKYSTSSPLHLVRLEIYIWLDVNPRNWVTIIQRLTGLDRNYSQFEKRYWHQVIPLTVSRFELQSPNRLGRTENILLMKLIPGILSNEQV